MRSKIIFILCILFKLNSIMNLSNAQSLFNRSFFGPRNLQEAKDIKQTSEGGYIVTGSIINSSSFFDVILLKLNPNGTPQWYKAFGSSSFDYGNSVIQSSDDCYVLAGSIWQYNIGMEDFYVIKTNSYGDTLWTRTFGSLNRDEANNIIQTNGGYVIAGTTFGSQNIDIHIIKITFNGEMVWSNTYYGLSNEAPSDINSTNDGAFIVTGYIKSNLSMSGTDILLMKINSSGNLVWTKNYGVADNDDYGRSVYQSLDNGYIICGRTQNSVKSSQIYLIKTDSTGNLVWSKTFGGKYYDAGTKVIPLSDGGYIVSGLYHPSEQISSSILVKVNSNGDTLFTRIYNNSRDSLNMNAANSFAKTNDKGYIFAGYPNMSILKTDSLGRTCKTYASGIEVNTPITIVDTPSLNEVSAAMQVGRSGSIYSVNLTSVDCSIPVGVKQISKGITNSYKFFQNYPNPFNPVTKINYELPITNYVTLKIYDALGKEVATLVNQKLSPGSYEVEFDGSNFSSGIYFYKLQTDNFNEVKRMILLK